MDVIDAIRQRMGELGLNNPALQRAAEVSHFTVTRLLNEPDYASNMRHSTEAQVCRALEWKPGSIRALLAGRQPTPITAAPANVAAVDRLSRLEADVLAMRQQLGEIAELLRHLPRAD